MVFKRKKEQRNLKADEMILDEIDKAVEQAKNDTITWRQNSDKYYKLRMRVKKTKIFPFPGCSNLRLPTIEMYIRKAKAALISIYASQKPRMQVIPQSDGNLEKAMRIEKFLDWVVDVKIRLLDKLVLCVDRMLERGFCLMKVVWRMEDECYTETIKLDDLPADERAVIDDPMTTDEMLEQFILERYNVDMSETVAMDNLEAVQEAIQKFRAGETVIKLKLRDEIYNAPDVVLVDALDCYVPGGAGIDVQKLPFIAHEYYRPYRELKAEAKYGILDEEPVDNIDYLATTKTDHANTVQITKDLREGIDRYRNANKDVRIREYYGYYDIDGDGIEEKCLILYAPDFRQVLKKQRLPYDHKKWPFVRFATEITDDRWFSPRGYVEHLEDFSKEIDAQHNQKIDNQTIRNAPMFLFRSGVINPKLVKFIPGQSIPVPGHMNLQDVFQVVNNNNPNVEFSYEREEMLLKSMIQEYMGQTDFSLSSVVNRRQPRTASEVNLQAQSQSTIFSLDSACFTESLGELFMQILELCQQYMPEEIVTLVTGSEGTEPLHLTRDEIQGKFHIISRGNDQNSNPVLRAQKALARAQLLMSPIPLQIGVVNPMNVYNILKRYLQEDGELGWKELISPPPPPPPPPPPATAIVPKFDDLEEGEQAQVLPAFGIQPDIPGRMLRKNMEIESAQQEEAAQSSVE